MSERENHMDTMANEETPSEPVHEVHIVRGISPEEVEAVLNMAAASGLFTSDALRSAEDMAWDSAYGEGGAPHTFILAKTREDGADKTIGFLCFGPIANWPENYELYGIAVVPEYQRLGIGSALVAEMARRIGSEKSRRVFLETGADRAYEGARGFYEANGFDREERFHKHFIPLEGGVVYRLNIDVVEDDGPKYQ
ncbi:MAG: GNAT family N-acetyltransferase [Pseudodesulfovibrio sp.]